MFKKIFFLIFIIVLLTGCTNRHRIEMKNKDIILTQKQEENIKLETKTATFIPLDVSITIPAQFKAIPILSNRIYSPVDGKIINVFVEQGQIVKLGQPMVEIQSDTIGQIESELLQSIIRLNSQIKMSQAQLEFVTNNYKRENILLKEKITSRFDWENAKTQMSKESANLSALKTEKTSMISVYQRRLQMYGADNRTIQKVLVNNKIYPFIILRAHQEGFVIKFDAHLDEFIPVNKELFEVANLSKIWLVGNLFEKDISSVNIGNTVKVKTDGLNGVKGKIIYVAPTLDLETKTLEVRAEIENKNYKIKPNMFTEMNIKTGTRTVLAVPLSAIQKIGDTTLVYVLVEPHVYSERVIKTGVNNDTYVEILSGLKENEVVVTKGSFSLLGETIKKTERE